MPGSLSAHRGFGAAGGRALRFDGSARSNGLWRSLVAHLTGGQGVAGSNPVSPTGVWPCQRPLLDHFLARVLLSCYRQFRIHSVSPRSRGCCSTCSCRGLRVCRGLSRGDDAGQMCGCLLVRRPELSESRVAIGLGSSGAAVERWEPNRVSQYTRQLTVLPLASYGAGILRR